jgi:hypothetical protein
MENMDSRIFESFSPFKQDVSEEDLKELVGKLVRAEGTITQGEEVKPFGFEGILIGYSKEVVFDSSMNPFYKFGFLTDEGMGFAIVKDMTWEVITTVSSTLVTDVKFSKVEDSEVKDEG